MSERETWYVKENKRLRARMEELARALADEMQWQGPEQMRVLDELRSENRKLRRQLELEAGGYFTRDRIAQIMHRDRDEA